MGSDRGPRAGPEGRANNNVTKVQHAVSGRSENHERAGFGNAFVLPGLLDRPQPRRGSLIGLSCFLATCDPGQRATDQNDL